VTASQPHAKSSLLPPGFTIGGYNIVRTVGEGAQAMVYEASRAEGPNVALKVIHRHLCGDPQIFGRFHREAAILKRIEGEHLVKCVDFVEEDGLLVIALELVDARSLEDVLRGSKAQMDIGRAIEIALQVCAALGVAHAGGVVHRDLKPANVLVEEARGDLPPRVRVVDFGLAKVLHGGQMTTGLTEQDMIFGTPEYMAPEQARGDEADGRADLYAAGVMLYEMVVGRVPFHARTPLATMTAHLTETPPPPRAAAPKRGIPALLEAVILRALAKSPDDRYPTARAFAEALASAREKDIVVVSPRKIEDVEGLSTSDTDLHVALGSAKTLPELSGLPELPAMPGANEKPTSTKVSQGTPLPHQLRSAAPVRNAGPTSAAKRKREGLVWIVIAIVAAAVGVVIGVVVGAR
jgi:serine/threonine-protein kinase